MRAGPGDFGPPSTKRWTRHSESPTASSCKPIGPASKITVYSSASTVRAELVEISFDVVTSKLLTRRALIFLTLDRGGGGGEFAERTVPNFRRDANGRGGCGDDQVKKME
jgi:hypothetical protein